MDRAGLGLDFVQQVLIVDDDQPVDALEHFEEVLLEQAYILHHAHNLDDLLVAEEV